MTSNELKHQAKLREWQEKITDCRSSGLSVREWCRQNSVAPTTYYRWEQELLRGIKRDEAAGDTLPVLAELRFTVTGVLLDAENAGMEFSLKAFCQNIYRTSELTDEQIAEKIVLERA